MNFQPIFWGGLIAGTLDICAAFLTAWLRAGVSPIGVLQFVASGALGPAAFQGGIKTCTHWTCTSLSDRDDLDSHLLFGQSQVAVSH